MDDYREKVRRLSLERTGEPFFNASEDHAAIIVENMFRTADREVCILTSHLAPKVYARDEVISWARIFLAEDKDHSLRVLMREGDLPLLSANPLFAATRDSRNIQVSVLQNELFDAIPFSFLVADGDSYRFEPDKTKCEAVAAFASSEAAKLQSAFERQWHHANPVNLDKLEQVELSTLN